MRAELASLEIEMVRLESRKQDLQGRISIAQAKRLVALLEGAAPRTVDRLIEELSAEVSRSGSALAGTEGNGSAPAIRPPATADQPRDMGMQFSHDVRQRVRAAFEEGVKTLSDLSREEGISKATLVKWRAEWGLQRPRGKPKPPGRA